MRWRGGTAPVDWLIVGLGNPGTRYAGTRHNVGFDVANALGARWDLPRAKTKYRGLFTEGRAGIGGPRIALLLPQTYMNEAGESVGPSTTLSALRPRLAAIGPSIAALADQAERMRFAADGTPEPAYPRVRVWRALARERGALRATLMSARLATRPAPAARS